MSERSLRIRKERGPRNARHLKGQMTVELAIALPVMLAVAAVLVNALTFFSECAAFDVALREAVRLCAISPGYGEDTDVSAANVRARLAATFNEANETVTVSWEDAGLGHTRFRGRLEFRATLFGTALREEVFGVRLRPLSHEVTFVVDRCKPGVIL